MKFNNIFGNPPFQDNDKRKKTQHKLWPEFTLKAVNEWLKDEGNLVWITPQSWGSPSNKILQLFKDNQVESINLDTKEHFPDIGSTFSHYHIVRKESGSPTSIVKEGKSFNYTINNSVLYFPNDFNDTSLEIHRKVMFNDKQKYKINYDYVTCHNVIRHAHKLHQKKIDKKVDLLKSCVSVSKATAISNDVIGLIKKKSTIEVTISETKTSTHIYPVHHTNNKTWYSSIKQDFADKKKVMWSRSGYTKPFYDNGTLGGTDMCYYILVNTDKEGEQVNNFLNSDLMTYVFKTAKWSGFGNEIVFSNIPKVDLSKCKTQQDYYSLFGITQQEIDYINVIIGKSTDNVSSTKKSEIKSKKRVKSLGEVFTPRELVDEMLEKVSPVIWQDKDQTFIDPACGNGNFLVRILSKRLDSGVQYEDALSTLYGIDIMQDNVDDCHERLIKILDDNNIKYNKKKVQKILNSNIVLSNSLIKNMQEIFDK
jgi:hypothetical protein